MLQNQLYTCDQHFLSPYPSVFPNLFLPKSPTCIPFPCLWFLPCPIRNITQAPCHVALDSGVSQLEVFSSIVSCWWVSSLGSGVEAPTAQFWERLQQGVSLPAVVLCWTYIDGLFMHWWCFCDELQSSGARVLLDSPTFCYVLLCAPLWINRSCLSHNLTWIRIYIVSNYLSTFPACSLGTSQS